MKEWISCLWGDISTIEYGKRLSGYEYSNGKYLVYGTNGKIGRHTESLCNHPGVIIGRKGAYRGVHYSNKPFFVIDTAFYLKPKVDMDIRWAYYKLLTYDINGLDTGSAIPSLNRESFYNLPVILPPLPIQQRIAEILGALDDKIECNLRINETLEQMVMAMYKHWFVDFGPFRDGEFEETEMGMIPKGWKISKLGNIANTISVIAIPDKLPEDTYYIGLEHMPKGSITLSEWGTVADVTSNKLKFLRKQILFGKLRPYFKKVGIAPFDGVCSSDILVIEPKSNIYYGMLLGQLIQDEFIDYTTACSGGTRMPRISWEQMSLYSIIIPPDNLVTKFADKINNWVDIIIHSISENNILSQTRDYLLPRLLSGQIEVKEAEKQVSNVV